eukprot:gene9031-6487_t
MTVQHAVYNGNAFRFSTSTGASLSFIRTVQELTSLPEAIIYINRVWDSNFTLVVPTGRRDLLESHGTEHVSAAAVSTTTTSTPVCYFNYTVKVWTTDIAPLATAAEVVTTLKSRLDTRFANDVFGLRLRQNTFIYGDSRLAVRSATTDSNLVSTVALSFSRQTNWLMRLREELHTRFDQRDRANRAMHFQLDLANTTYFSTPAQYASFMSEITRPLAINRRLKVVALLTGNESSGAMVEYKCDEEASLRSLRQAFQLNDRTAYTVSCHGATWRTKYCSATDAVPTLCVNCVDPCREPCYREPVTRISTVLAPTPHNCSLFDGTLKVFHVEGYQPEINPDYVASSLGALWVVLGLTVGVMVVYHRYLIVFRLPTGFDPHEVDDGSAAVPTWDPEKALAGRWSAATGTRPRPGGGGGGGGGGGAEATDPRNDIDHRYKLSLIQTLNDDIFGLFHLYHSTIGRWVHALVIHHRILRIFTNFWEEGWNIFWFATSLAAYGLLIASMLQAQYPYDDGHCASLATRAACESYRSPFIDHRHTCTWLNAFTAAQEALLGDVLDYQTNCVFDSRQQVPASDVFRLALLGVLCVGFCRLTLLEPFVKRFLMPPLATTTPTTVMEMEVIDEKGSGQGGGGGGGGRMIITPATERGDTTSSVRRLQRTDSTLSALGGVGGGSRVSLKNNAVQPQQMQDFMLEIHFPAPTETQSHSHGHGHGRGGATRQSALMQVNLVPRKEIDEGLKTLANAHVFDMETDNLYKYDVEIRPTAATTTTTTTTTTKASVTKGAANEEDSLSSVWARWGWWFFSRLWSSSRDAAGRSGVTIVHRAPEQFRDEEFRQFYGHLMAHRVTFLPADTYRWRFDYHWGLQEGGHFDADRVLHRSLTWQAQHHFQVQQAAGDYFHEYINHISHVAATERVEATHHPTSLPLRILLLFVLDVMGHFSVEAGLLRRRLYRRVNPRAAVAWWVKGGACLGLMGLNAVLLYYTWETVKFFPQSLLHNWFRALIVAAVVDFFFVENVDNAWCQYVVPSTCLAAFHYAKDEVIRLILQTNFVAPSRGTAATATAASNAPYGRRAPTDGSGGGGASVASGVSSAMRPLRPSGSAMSLLSRSMGMPARTNSAASLMSLAQQRPFDTPDYFFVSRKFARLFPSFPESQLVLQYHTDLPRRVKVGAWRRNTDVDVEHEPLFPCVAWCLSLVRGDHHRDEAPGADGNDDDASMDTDEQRRQQIQRQHALAERRRALRDEVTWGDRLYARWSIEQARWRARIVYLGSLSTWSQRLVVQWVFVGLLLLLWWLVPQIELLYFWYASAAVVGVALLVSVTLCGYYHSFFIRDMLDEAQYLSWLHCFGVAPTEYPPHDPLVIDDVPDDEWDLLAANAAAAEAAAMVAGGGSRAGGGHRDDASDVSSLSDGDGVRPMMTHDVTTAVPFTPSRGRLGSPAKRSSPSSAASSQQQQQPRRHRQGTAETSPGTDPRPPSTAAYADDDVHERHSPSPQPPSGAAQQPWSIDWQPLLQQAEDAFGCGFSP